ncbi:uncharacterized protein LOC144358501, partial [Saccoglossus kowalevskii]
VPFNVPLTVNNVKEKCCIFYNSRFTSSKLLGGTTGPEFTCDDQIQSKTSFYFYKADEEEDDNSDDDKEEDDDHVGGGEMREPSRSFIMSDIVDYSENLGKNEFSASAKLKSFARCASDNLAVSDRKRTAVKISDEIPTSSIGITKFLKLGTSLPCTSLEKIYSSGLVYIAEIKQDGIKWIESAYPIKFRIGSFIGEGGICESVTPVQ